MPKTKAKNGRKQAARPSQKVEFVRPLAFMDSSVIMMALQLVKISGAAAEDLVRLKSELRRVTAPATPAEELQLAKQALAQQAAAQPTQ